MRHSLTMPPRFALFLLVLVGLVPGCRSKAELDKTVDEIVASMSECDHERLDKLIDEKLAAELEQKFDGMCATVAWFGELKERDQTGIHVSPGESKGNYNLKFDKGELQFELLLKDKKITGFEFKGEDWYKAKRELEAEKFSEFKVYGFDWLDADGKPHSGGNKYGPGQINYRINIGGIEAKDGKFSSGLTTRILDPNGNKLWESPKPDILDFDQDSQKIVRSGNLSGSVTIPQKGTFRIEFDIEDRVSGKKTQYSQAVIVE